MSRKSTHKHHAAVQHCAASDKTAISPQELQERWNALHLKAETREQLQHLLQEDIQVALLATTTLSLEQEERSLSRSLTQWGQEQIRSLLLEEGSAHVVESGHAVVGAITAWNLLPAFAVHLHVLLPGIALGGLVAYFCLGGVAQWLRTGRGLW